MVILAVSDVHIGYPNSEIKLFNHFLDDVIKRVTERNDVDKFVILGDFIDMWRRDVSGLFLENHKTLELLLALKQKTAVHYIVGNHDYHLRKLVLDSYPIRFEKEKRYPKCPKPSDVIYVFKHGYEFDPMQCRPVMEYLCQNMSDNAGQVRSDFWSWITRHPKSNECTEKAVKEYVKTNNEGRYNLFTKGNQRKKYISSVQTPAKERKSSAFHLVEMIARGSLQDGEILVFGHTHRPFVSEDRRLINVGSWVSEEDTPNTYAELDGANVKLMQYNVGDITEKLTKPY
jgi:Uncharacterized protein conserved in bacteria